MTSFKETSIANVYLIQSFWIWSHKACMKYDPLLGSLYEEHPGAVENANKKSLSSGMTSSTVSSSSVSTRMTSFRALATGLLAILPTQNI